MNGGAWIPVLAEFEDREKLKDAEGLWKKLENAALRAGGECRIYGAPVKEGLLFLAVFIPEVSFLIIITLMTKLLNILQEVFTYMDMSVFMCAGRICICLLYTSGYLNSCCRHGLVLAVCSGYGTD